jgi:hypothetical protein
MSHSIATIANALTSAKNVCASNIKLEGPETWTQWYDTIKNVMMDTTTGATSGVFKNMSVWDSIMSDERHDKEQHGPSQRFAQQMISGCISKANYDVIKSIPEDDPDEEDNDNYNRTRLQILALQEDHASSSTATRSILTKHLKCLKIDDFKKKGVKDSRAITLFFQAHANLVHRLNAISKHPRNDQDLLYDIKENLAERHRDVARRATSVADLKHLLIVESQMYLDSIDTEEQVFKTEGKPPGERKGVCWGWSESGSCHFGSRCRFLHETRRSNRTKEAPYTREPSYISGRQDRRRQQRQVRPLPGRGSNPGTGWRNFGVHRRGNQQGSRVHYTHAQQEPRQEGGGAYFGDDNYDDNIFAIQAGNRQESGGNRGSGRGDHRGLMVDDESYRDESFALGPAGGEAAH